VRVGALIGAGVAAVVTVAAVAAGDGAEPAERMSLQQTTSGETTTTSPETTTGPVATTPAGPPVYDLTVREALGQMVVARYPGLTPTPGLLARVRRGEVGGVILFADNVRDGAQVKASVARLNAASRSGGHPKVLVMVDQEGGLVKRLAGPPSRAASAMRTPTIAEREGRATGRMLRRLGILVDLAPVADVAGPRSFLGTRAFGRSPSAVAERACAFAAGLRSAGVAATLKHFPGLGTARTNTDDEPTAIPLGREALRRGYAPYRRCGREPGTLVMLASASYPRAIGPRPAVLERATYRRELPAAGGTALTISDDLEAPAVVAHSTPARRAVNAGLDLLLYARSESGSAVAYQRLLADVRAGRIRERRVQQAALRMLDLKARLARGLRR